MDIVRVRVGTAWSERLTTLTVLRSGTRAARTLEAVRCFALKGLARERMGHPRAAHPHAISHVPPDLVVVHRVVGRSTVIRPLSRVIEGDRSCWERDCG